MNHEEKVIPLWLMVFDQNPCQNYLFTSKAKVFASVEGLVRSAIPDDISDEFVNAVLTTLDNTWDAPFIPMKFHSTQLFIHRLEIDKHNPIHQALTKCKDALESGVGDQDAIESVDDLLIDPVALGR